MIGAQWVLESALVLLLGATLFHALRLERALGVLKRDRAVLEELVEGFNDSTRQAESGIERLRHAADGAGRAMARQIETAQRLRDDLAFLADRSDRLAERLEAAVRSARMVGDGSVLQAAFAAQNSPQNSLQNPGQYPAQNLVPHPAPSSGAPALAAPIPADRIGLAARPPAEHGFLPQGEKLLAPASRQAMRAQALHAVEAEEEAQPRLRSQAERDLLRALRGAR